MEAAAIIGICLSPRIMVCWFAYSRGALSPPSSNTRALFEPILTFFFAIFLSEREIARRVAGTMPILSITAWLTDDIA